MTHLSQSPEQPSGVNDLWHLLARVRLGAVTPEGDFWLSPAALAALQGTGRLEVLPPISIHCRHRAAPREESKPH